MYKATINPSDAKKNFYQLLKNVNENHTVIHIISEGNENDAVLISKKDWNSIQETLLLEQTSVLEEVRKREADDSGLTDIEIIDWDSL